MEFRMTARTLFALLTCICLLEIVNLASVYKRPQSPQETVDKWIAQHPAGAVAAVIVSPSETEYFFGGQLAPDNRAFPNARTIFEIGSITKGFTGLLLADQVLTGNVYLNDTLSKLLTDWPGRFTSKVGNVTLLELTTHSAGLPMMPPNMEDLDIVYTKKQMYAWLDTAEPSQRGIFSYSNTGVALLGEALAVNAGKAYEELVKERVLLPLGLRDATITLSDEQRQRQAPGHGFDGRLVPNMPFEVLAPAGAMRLSVSELARFLQFTTGLAEHEERMKEALKMATSLWGKVSGTTTIGLCWLRTKMPEDRLRIWHSGSTIGYNAYLIWIPERQIGVGVLTSLLVATNNTVDVLGLELLNSVS